MKASEVFPSKYFKAADLNGPKCVVIDRVEMVRLQADEAAKPVIYFKDLAKGFVANVTNIRKIASIYGEEMDDWSDQPIELYPIEVEFQGETTLGIRVRKPAAPPLKQTAQQAKPKPEHIEVDPSQADPLDDAIPL